MKEFVCRQVSCGSLQQQQQFQQYLFCCASKDEMTAQHWHPRLKHDGCCVMLQVLYQKQGRNAQFDSAEERDNWLRSEAKTLEEALVVKRRNHAELEAQVQQASTELMDLSQVRPAPRPGKQRLSS